MMIMEGLIECMFKYFMTFLATSCLFVACLLLHAPLGLSLIFAGGCFGSLPLHKDVHYQSKYRGEAVQ